jgi:hypothetical protein
MLKEMASNRRVRSEVVEQAVRKYFHLYPSQTYLGLIRVSEVVDYVRATLAVPFGFRLTEYVRGEIYDRIREFGPEGEEDCHWLETWCQSEQPCECARD